MPGLQTPAALAALKTRLFKTFQDGLAATAPVSTDPLCTRVQIDTEFLTADWLAGITGMREWIGPREAEGLKERAYQIYVKHWEKLIEVSRDALDDSPMTAAGNAAIRLSMLMETGRKVQDDILIDLIKNGHQRTCYDGQYYFDTDHPVDLDSTGSQSNYESTGFALTGPNFATAQARMLSFRNESGRPLVASSQLLLVVPPALKKAADEIVTAVYGSSGASNVLNGQAKVHVIPELGAAFTGGSDTAWYLFGGPEALILAERKPLTFAQRVGETDSPVFERNVYQFGIDRRCGGGYGVWQRAFKGVA